MRRGKVYSFDTSLSDGIEKIPVGAQVVNLETKEAFIKDSNIGLTESSTLYDAEQLGLTTPLGSAANVAVTGIPVITQIDPIVMFLQDVEFQIENYRLDALYEIETNGVFNEIAPDENGVFVVTMPEDMTYSFRLRASLPDRVVSEAQLVVVNDILPLEVPDTTDPIGDNDGVLLYQGTTLSELELTNSANNGSYITGTGSTGFSVADTVSQEVGETPFVKISELEARVSLDSIQMSSVTASALVTTSSGIEIGDEFLNENGDNVTISSVTPSTEMYTVTVPSQSGTGSWKASYSGFVSNKTVYINNNQFSIELPSNANLAYLSLVYSENAPIISTYISVPAASQGLSGNTVTMVPGPIPTVDYQGNPVPSNGSYRQSSTFSVWAENEGSSLSPGWRYNIFNNATNFIPGQSYSVSLWPGGAPYSRLGSINIYYRYTYLGETPAPVVVNPTAIVSTGVVEYDVSFTGLTETPVNLYRYGSNALSIQNIDMVPSSDTVIGNERVYNYPDYELLTPSSTLQVGFSASTDEDRLTKITGTLFKEYS